MNKVSFLGENAHSSLLFFSKDHLYFRSQMKNAEGGRGENGKEI